MDPESYANELPGDEEDESAQEIFYGAQKEAVLFLIEVSPTMLQDSGDCTSSVKHALECAYSFMTHKIIASPNDMIGVLLYGTELTQCPASYGYTACKNAYLLVDMDCPDASKMKELKSLLTSTKKFASTISPAAELPTMTNVLFLANGIFSQRAANFNFNRIILITDNDDPHMDNKSAKQAAVTRARDLNDLGIKIEPVFITTQTKPFDPNKFYEEIVFREDDDLDRPHDLIEEGEKRLVQMMDQITAKISPKRAVFSIPLEIGSGLSISIKGYILYKEQKISKSANIYNMGAFPEFVRTETTNVCLDTSKQLEKNEIKRGYKFGSDRIIFSDEELSKVKYIEEPILRIIGFKKFDKLRIWHNLRPSYFIYPSEDSVIGSTRVFASLHHNLLDKQKWALGWFIPRRNASPALVAVIAGPEVVSPDTHMQVAPPGLFLVALPFADDIRQDPMQHANRAPTELVDKMSDIVQNLRLASYEPSKYQNPALQWHWRILQAMALEEDMPEAQADKTLPKYKGIDKRAGQLMQDWTRILTQHVSTRSVSEPQKKRQAVTRPKDSPKRSKVGNS